MPVRRCTSAATRSGRAVSVRLLRVHALGDHDDGHGGLQRLAQAVDGPVDASRADAEHDEVRVAAKCCAELLVLKGARRRPGA